MPTFPTLSFACPVDWNSMRGDERERFCSKCARTVVNISALTEEQRRTLLANAQPGELCVAYYRRLSGEFVSAERPLTATERRGARQYGLASLSAAALALSASCVATNPQAVAQAKQDVLQAYDDIRDEAIELREKVVEKITGRPSRRRPVIMFAGAIMSPRPTSVSAPASGPAPGAASSAGSAGNSAPTTRT